MNNPIVSIVVPCYKQAQYLAETLDSVLSQTYKNWECIIVNDGSPDNTEEIATQYCIKDIRFKYFKQENQGLAQSRNNGIRMSSGEFILPLDSDDKIGSTYIEKCVRHFQVNPACKIVYCKAEFFGGKHGLWQLEDYDYKKIIWGNCIFCTALYRRKDFDIVGGYNPNMKYGWEDWDFWLAILKPSDKVFRIDEVLFYYRVKEKSMVTSLISHYEEMYRQIFNNHPMLYTQYFENVLWWRARSTEAEIYEKENKVLSARLSAILSSNSYKLGCFLSFPIRYIKDLLIKRKSKLLV